MNGNGNFPAGAAPAPLSPSRRCALNLGASLLAAAALAFVLLDERYAEIIFLDDHGEMRVDAGGLPGRFPRRSSDGFRRECSWVTDPDPHRDWHGNCTVHHSFTPSDINGKEEVSRWSSEVTSAYILSRMGGCRFLFDCGPGVDLRSLSNWELPPENFVCREEENCVSPRFNATEFSPEALFRGDLPVIGHVPAIPWYGFILQYPTGQLFREEFSAAYALLPGFKLETGMACAAGNMFDLTPNASGEEQLVSDILPTLRANPSIAMYIPTGKAEPKGEGISLEHGDERQVDPEDIIGAFVATALEYERRYIAGELAINEFGRTKSRVPPSRDTTTLVWHVITDSQHVKDEIKSKHDGKVVHNSTSPLVKTKAVISGSVFDMSSFHIDNSATIAEDNDTFQRSIITRRVFVTNSQGIDAHLPHGAPAKYFSEAIVDWYLIGESDGVIASPSYSFGIAGALRTARPIYDPTKFVESGNLEPETIVSEGKALQ